MVSRADKITQVSKSSDRYSDFLNNFTRHPLDSSLARITNEASVKQSIRNLILTNRGERLFQPNVGSDIHRTLFEPLTAVTAQDITNYITKTIQYNEPRANLLNVRVYQGANENSINVTIVFSLINSNNPTSLDVILKRVR